MREKRSEPTQMTKRPTTVGLEEVVVPDSRGRRAPDDEFLSTVFTTIRALDAHALNAVFKAFGMDSAKIEASMLRLKAKYETSNKYRIHDKRLELRDHEMTISDMARCYGVSLRTLQFYEGKDLLHPRRVGTARFYDAADRTRLELILKGKRLGFTLSEIYDLIATQSKHLSRNTSSQDAYITVSLSKSQISLQIEKLEHQKKELDDAIEELRNAYARLDGR